MHEIQLDVFEGIFNEEIIVLVIQVTIKMVQRLNHGHPFLHVKIIKFSFLNVYT